MINHYNVDKKGYNYRICCLYSLGEVMPMISKETISNIIVPVFLKGAKDDIPNVRFCVFKIIADKRAFIDSVTFNNIIVPCLKDNCNESDKDVSYFAQQALSASV